MSLKLQACNFNKKETQAKVFSCEFCEIFKNTYCYRTPLMAVSINIQVYCIMIYIDCRLLSKIIDTYKIVLTGYYMLYTRYYILCGTGVFLHRCDLRFLLFNISTY